jgi:soluble lytic murein transglycosylase-like protein
VGIAQFMPATAKDLGVDPLDPIASIDKSGGYLRRLYDSLGSWDKALAAYNWGIGNVKRKGLVNAPTETRLYVSQILSDVGG